MAFSQFTYEKVQDELGIKIHFTQLFTDISPLAPTKWLVQTLAMNTKLAFFSEKSRSEAIIFPILVDIWEQKKQSFAIYSGPDFEADKEKGLTGECDFVLGKGEQGLTLDSPLLCMIEAKDQDMKKAIPQGIAQMEGAKIFNEKHNKNIPIIWGCVTTGELWLFMKLQDKKVLIDTKRYFMGELQEILGVLQLILAS